jgi:hypothetical protein
MTRGEGLHARAVDPTVASRRIFWDSECLGLSVPMWYHVGMVKAYTTVELEERLDRYRLRTRASRSAVISLALEEFLDRELAERSSDGRVGSSPPTSGVGPALGADAPGGTSARSASFRPDFKKGAKP